MSGHEVGAAPGEAGGESAGGDDPAGTSGASGASGASGTSGMRDSFRDWRRSRPFWAGVWTLLAGVEILSIPIAPLALMIHEGVAGVAGALMGIFLVVLGIAMWLSPEHRVFAGIAALVFAVASLVLSNFGGFLLGFLLGIIGGAMAVSWGPAEPAPPREPPVWPGWGPGERGGGPGPGGPPADGTPDRGAPGAPRVERRRRILRADRLRALGILPVGALLAGTVQPQAGPPHPAADAAGPPSPSPPGGLCSLLGALLAAGPTTHGTGSAPDAAGAARQPGLRLGVDGPLGVHASVGVGVPPQRTAPGPAPARSAPAPPVPGLVKAVTGLLGVPAGEPSPSAAAPSAPPAARSAPGRPAPAPARPAPPAPRPPADPQAPKAAPGSVDVPRPPLPRDGRMDAPMSLLPLHLTLGDPSASSPGCTPSVSLDLSLGAAAYRDGVAAAQPFRVLTPLLFLTGLTYQGITEVPSRDGPQRVLVFTASRVDIASLRQTAALLPPSCGPYPPSDHPPFHGLPGLRLPLLDLGLPGIGFVDPRPVPWNPCQGRLETDAAPGSTSSATGQVVLLTKVLSGSLLGLLPVTFTPDMPPPLPPGLTLPIPIFFTGVTTYLQMMRADALSIPGLHQFSSR